MENRYTVLIVDDAMTNIVIMSEMLKDNYDLVAATNGTDALKIMRGKKRPDVVLLDMIMPELDGYEVLRIMSGDEELRTMPVIVVTADSDPKARERAYSLGAVDFITRGDAQSVIRHRIRSVLRLRETEKISQENELLKRAMTSERQLSVLMDNLPGGVATIRTDGKRAECKYFNSKIPALFRMNHDSFAMQFAMPKLPEWLDTLVKKAKNSDSFTFSFEVGDRNDPSVRQWIRVTAGGIGEKDGMQELYCVFLDINAEKHNELRAEESGRQLRENQTRLETVVNNAPGGILYSERDENGKFHIKYINQGLVDALGYSDYDECLNTLINNPKIGVSTIDEMTILGKIAAIPEEGGNFQYSFKTTSAAGNELWLTMRCQMLKGEDGIVKMYAFVSDNTKEKIYENELRSAAYFDSLTGLFNRHAFIQNARSMLDENPLTEFSLMTLNIGSFKVVNDLLGRDVGDKVLNIIADAIRETFTGRGVFARFFSDNFIVLTPYSERGVHPQTFLDAVQNAVAESGLISHEVQYYIGVYKITERDMSIENMADRAAIACRSINGSYQEHIAYYDEKMRLTMIEEQEICDESRRALQNGEFCVYYQPVYGIKAKRFVSAEALVRWNHPTKGMISPGKFVPVFEKNGFIAELDLYVLEQVCKYMKRRNDEGLPKFPISVNISRMSLYDPNLFETINAITDTYNIDPKFFRIEITESAYNDNPAQLLETIGKLREKCYPVLMDDFGSGYSSLNTLKDIPIDILKLDMKFMQGFEKNGKVGTIVTSVSRMAKWLNIPMLAEGVETKEQFDFLVSVGCAYIQGYYFSRPVYEEEFTRLIALDEVTGDSSVIESYGLGEEVNELLGSNALVSKLISGAFGGFGIYEMYDNKLEVIRVNDGYRKIMGYTPGSFEEERTNIWDMMPPEDAELARKACLEAIRTDKAVSATVRRYDTSGKLLYLEGIHRKLGGTEENPIICIAFNDITDKIVSEYQIDRSRTEIEEILNATGSVVVDIDYVNDTAFHAGDMSDFGIDLDKIRDYIDNGDAFENVVHQDDLKKVKRFYSNKEPGKMSEELRIRNKKDGNYYWWRFTEVRKAGDDGKISRTIGIANNIDSEKRATIALEKERAYVDSVMNQISVGILTVGVTDDHKAHIIFSNDSFWRIIGHDKPSDDEFFGRIYDGLIRSDVDGINDTVGNGGTVNSEYNITRSNGEKAVLEMSVGLSRVDDGNRVYMIIISDITERYHDRVRIEDTNRLYRLVVEQTHTAVIEINHNENKIAASPLFKKFWSVDFSEDKGEQYEYVKQGPIVHQDDLKKYEEFMKKIYKTHEPQTITLRMKMADGTFQWCRMSISIEWGEDGRVLTSLCTINFVHDEIVARMKAEQTDALMRRTVANMPVGVGVYKLENGHPAVLYVSNYMNEMSDKNGEIYFDVERFIEKNNIEFTSGAEGNHIYQIKKTNGTVCWLSVLYRVLDEDGEPIIYMAIADVTDRVESRRREAASEQMYSMLLNDSGTTVFDYDPQTDAFTYIFYSGDNSAIRIDNITENIDRLTIIQDTDRKEFLNALKSMPQSADPEEMLVHMIIDRYPRRCNVLFKSVEDENGNVFNIIGRIEDVEDELARIELMQEKAMYDSLCVDIFNKPTTESLVRAELERRTSGALMMIDVDDFKSINDSFGHLFGDEFLKKFATTIKSTFRESDIVGRYGGDEFFVFMPYATASLAERRAQQLLEKISEINVPVEGGVKSSIGIAAVTPENRDYKRILKQADSALYQAKNRGKNCAVLFEGSMNEETYRTKEAVERGRTKVELSSNPESAASIAMRVFSSLYTSTDMNEGIDRILALVGKTYDVSRVHIFEDSEDGEYWSETFEWCADGVESMKEALQNIPYNDGSGGKYRENFGDDGIFYCHDINELEGTQRELMAKQNIKSVLQCAIMDSGKFRGVVGFDECRSNRFWTQDQIDGLAFISKVLSIFLMIDRTRTKSENSAKKGSRKKQRPVDEK